jgi:hypothetical protein
MKNNSNMTYDYVIVGAGPCGLTLSYTLGKLGKKCVLLESSDSIGGCHRVARTLDGLFSEHGPRIYSTSYKNTIQLLKDMGLDFFDLFVPYDFSIWSIGTQSAAQLTWREKFWLVWEFFKLLLGIESSRKTSVKQFMHAHEFSDLSQDYVDRLCRLTDGAGADRYSLWQFLQLANQQLFYTIYQPKTPNDVGLFPLWQKNLRNVDLLLNTQVVKLNKNEQRIDSITVKTLAGQYDVIHGDKFILAMPPENLVPVLQASGLENVFGKNLKVWSEQQAYINDIPVIFHWNQKLSLPKIWGFETVSDWGLASIVLSNYMDFQDQRSQTVISTCITITDKKSQFIQKTANECDKKELISEVFRQLKETYPNLPPPSYSLLYSGIFRENNKWINSEKAFVAVSNGHYIPNQTHAMYGLYNAGTHNGNSFYGFTTMESAVQNALALAHDLEPNTRKIYSLQSPFTLVQLFRWIIVICFFLVTFIYYMKHRPTFSRGKS